MALNTDKKKSAKKTPAAEKPASPPERKIKNEITFGIPIETDRIRVEVDGTVIHYTLKATGEKLQKDYGNLHAVMIIHGRISRDPHGPYTQACIGKIRASNLKTSPI